MKTLVLAFLLLFAASPIFAQFQHKSNPSWNPGDPVKTAATVSTTTCPGTGCVVVSTMGASTVFVSITVNGSCPGANCTLQFSCSNDNWATVKPMAAYTVASGVVGGTGQTIAAAGSGDYAFPPLGFQQCGVVATSYTSGSPGIRVDADPSAFFSASQATSPGHRVSITLNADGVTPAVSNTVITFAKNVSGTVAGGLTTYTVTSGKTLRVQAVHFSKTNTGASATRVVGYFRMNTAGACVAGSGIVMSCEMGDSGMGTSAANQAGNSCTIPLGDGYEIVGNGTIAICLSEAASGTGATLTADLIGYEY